MSVTKVHRREQILLKNKRIGSNLNDRLFPIIGRASLLFDLPRRLLTDERRGNSAGGSIARDDRTGVVVRKAGDLKVWWNDAEILYIEYGSFGHSFWRAQEFSLMRHNMKYVSRPLLDFGCGDGSFARGLFQVVEYGVDIHDEALEIAKEFNLYNTLLVSSTTGIPVGNGIVGCVISNSVLEHLDNLEIMLREIHRILRNKGSLIFTVPVRQYERDLIKYYGSNAAGRISWESCHRNLLEIEDWTALLGRCGFDIVLLKQYQPDWFTFWFRMFRLLGDHGFAMFIRDIRDRVWNRYHSNLIRMVQESISETRVGGNIFVVAKRR